MNKPMKKAIIVVSFGTTYEETRKKNIENIINDLKDKYPSCRVAQAYTSSIVRKKLLKDGIEIPDVSEILGHLHQEGYEDIVILSTHVIPGEEYEMLEAAVCEQREKFHSCHVSAPLLATDKDCADVLEVLWEEYGGENRGILAMGHGSAHPANAWYIRLNEIIKERGMQNFYVATVEGTPTVADAIAFFKGQDCTSITLVPLMFVAGDHAINDMAGEEKDSWKSLFEKEGYQVNTVLKGLGEYVSIRGLYKKHLEDVMYGGRS